MEDVVVGGTYETVQLMEDFDQSDVASSYFGRHLSHVICFGAVVEVKFV